MLTAFLVPAETGPHLFTISFINRDRLLVPLMALSRLSCEVVLLLACWLRHSDFESLVHTNSWLRHLFLPFFYIELHIGGWEFTEDDDQKDFEDVLREMGLMEGWEVMKKNTRFVHIHRLTMCQKMWTFFCSLDNVEQINICDMTVPASTADWASLRVGRVLLSELISREYLEWLVTHFVLPRCVGVEDLQVYAENDCAGSERDVGRRVGNGVVERLGLFRYAGLLRTIVSYLDLSLLTSLDMEFDGVCWCQATLDDVVPTLTDLTIRRPGISFVGSTCVLNC